MDIENNYDFKKNLITVHKSNIYEESTIKQDEIDLSKGIFFSGETDEIIENGKTDFLEFLKVSMKIENPLNESGIEISLIKDIETLKDMASYKGHIIAIKSKKIIINGYDSRGICSAFYELEDLMERRKSPFLKKRIIKNKPLFSPRIVHSAYGLEDYPEEYMQKIVHEGIDAIAVFVKGINQTQLGYCDFNALIKKANLHGLDVYAYSMLSNFNHPDDENAEETFYDIYGKFFKEHNGFKGIIFVGESIEFPSKDEKVARRHYYETPEDNIPDGKPSPGWWPCKDYGKWISLISKCIRKEKPDAEIVLWTYNWGYAPKKDRIALLNSLPQDIIVQVTFEMFQKYNIENVKEMVCDYSLASVGPGDYFVSEAKICKKRNLKLYTMSNTGGRTWDFGMCPYEPMPYQWLDRYKKIIECKKEYGLKGIMECHHYGFTPSFITKLEKYCFESGGDFNGKIDYERYFDTVVENYFGKEKEKIKKGLKYISESIKYYPPTDEMQYGAMRIGTAYPFCLIKEIKQPQKEKVSFGLLICDILGEPMNFGRYTIYSVRNIKEIPLLEKMIFLYEKGISELNTIKIKNYELFKLINLLKFMKCCLQTAINAKIFYRLKTKIYASEGNKEIHIITDEIKKVAKEEIKNSKESIEYVDKDSSLGYEISMGYQCDKKHILWKIKQLNYMINVELKIFEDSIKNSKN